MYMLVSFSCSDNAAAVLRYCIHSVAVHFRTNIHINVQSVLIPFVLLFDIQ